MTVQETAIAAGVAPATVNHRFGGKDGLQREVFRIFIDSAVVVLDFTRAKQAYLQSVYARALVGDEFAAGIRELHYRVFGHLRSLLGYLQVQAAFGIDPGALRDGMTPYREAFGVP